VQQLAADALELLGDGEVGGVQVDVVPAESEDLAVAKSEDEDQDKRTDGGVHSSRTSTVQDQMVSTLRRFGGEPFIALPWRT
jgi:hypothetical protein